MRTIKVTVEDFEATRTIRVPIKVWPNSETKMISIELPDTQTPSRISVEEIQLSSYPRLE